MFKIYYPHLQDVTYILFILVLQVVNIILNKKSLKNELTFSFI